MGKLIKLVRNENMKVYNRAGTWVMIGILVLTTLIVGIFNQYMFSDSTQLNWKTQVNGQISSLERNLENPHIPQIQKKILEKDLMIHKYRLENNIPPVSSNSFWGNLNSSSSLVEFITLFTIIIAATSVSAEFSWGTIKLLLIRPVSRSKVLLSKYLSSLLFALTLLVILFFSSVIFGGLLFGFEDVSQPYLSLTNGNVVETSMFMHIFSLYGYSSVNLIMMVTFAFMISTVFRSNALSIGLSIFLMFTGTQIVMLLSRYDWSKYILFANTNLMQYVDGTPLVSSMTMTFSIIMLIVYFLIFNLLSWIIFNKRDITA